MTYQQKLHLERESDRVLQAAARQPCARIGYHWGAAGVTVIDKAGRIAMVNLDVTALDQLISDATEVRRLLKSVATEPCPETERNDVIRSAT